MSLQQPWISLVDRALSRVISLLPSRGWSKFYVLTKRSLCHVDKLSERVHGASMLKIENSSKSILWADWTDTVTDLSPLLRWPDDKDDDADTQEPFEVSESTLALLKKSFTSTLPQMERHKLRRMFHIRNIEDTRCPTLDSVFKMAGLSLRGEVKAFEQDLARMQAFILDPTGPLVQLLEACQSGTVEQDEAKSTHSGTITLLRNRSSQISKLRRKKVLKKVNADIQDLDNEEEIFKDAAPKLFGNGFKELPRKGPRQ